MNGYIKIKIFIILKTFKIALSYTFKIVRCTYVRISDILLSNLDQATRYHERIFFVRLLSLSKYCVLNTLKKTFSFSSWIPNISVAMFIFKLA
jgi:hypothetical protein